MTILPAENLLARETSPYLRQHEDNPVHWRPWSRDALDEAERLDRPILLSIGYAACHWCHVMAHESFENHDVADVMNRLFVNIKVDREERPDIDQIYMAALTAMGEQGGWPLTIFLTPTGKPFWGGTYFPREPRFGRPGIVQVLEAVAKTWNEKRQELSKSADALNSHVEQRLAPAAGAAGGIDSKTLPAFAGSIYDAVDHDRGGLRGAPKFPNAPLMHVLWASGVPEHRSAVVASLKAMLAGGIYDHVGGGLCRYSTDGEWLVPHFEKMLYDNAQLINLAAYAHAATGGELFRVRIEETVDWLRREMLLPSGGLASSLDADSDGEEGKFYTWTEAGLADVLGPAAARRFLETYRLSKPESWEGDPIVHRPDHRDFGPVDTDPEMIAARAALLAAREGRVRPGRDDKVLVDWNGLALAALATAGRVFGRQDWITFASDVFRFVAESAVDGRLPHSIHGDRRLFPGLSSDHAAMIDAAVALAQATGDARYAERAREWLRTLDDWYADEAGTGFYLTASDAADVPMRVRGDVDEATPSATAQVIEAMLRLALLTSDTALYERGVTVATHALGRVASQQYGQAGVVRAAELVRNPKKLILVDAADGELVSVANRSAAADRVDARLDVCAGGSVTLPDGATLDTGAPGAWLCIGQTCLPPVRDADGLARLLAEPL